MTFYELCMNFILPQCRGSHRTSDISLTPFLAPPCITTLRWTALSFPLPPGWRSLPAQLHCCGHGEEEGWRAATLCLTPFPPRAEHLCLPRKVLVQSRVSAGSVAAPDGSGSGSETPTPRQVVEAEAFQRGESGAKGGIPEPQEGRRI